MLSFSFKRHRHWLCEIIMIGSRLIKGQGGVGKDGCGERGVMTGLRSSPPGWRGTHGMQVRRRQSDKYFVSKIL